MNLIRPDWPVADRVKAFATSRHGGVSEGPWQALNLGLNCGDAPDHVEENRVRLRSLLPADPCWLAQVHGTDVIALDQWRDGVEADAAWTDQPHQAAVVLTADCLPVLLAAEDGTTVAAVHAGWRGLAGGILDRAVDAMPPATGRCHAWIGPGICGDCYQVGDEVREALTAGDMRARRAFRPDGSRWRADLKFIAGLRLQRRGVQVCDAVRCTHCETDEFFSFRRDGVTGRLASLIWLEY
jgi:polyphenol oxidase